MSDTRDIYIPPRPGYVREAPEPTVDAAKCRASFWWLTAYFAIWLPLIIGGTNAANVFTPNGLIPINMWLYTGLALGSFVAFYVQLGRLAVRNGKSWVVWALLPFMFFFIGGVFMFIRMIFLGRERRWL